MPQPNKPRASLQRLRWRITTADLFLLPYLFVLIAFGIAPAIYAILVTTAVFDNGVPRFFAAGTQNVLIAVHDYRFGEAFGNIFHFLLVALPFGVIGVVMLSLFLHARDGWFANRMRTLFFLPGAVAGPSLVLLAIFMFDPQISPFGPLLHLMGFQLQRDVFKDAHYPLIFTLIGFFAGAGGWIAIFWGGLNSIPTEIIEAAKVDGCTAWLLATRIKMPMISRYIAYMLIVTFAGSVQLFIEPQLLTNAGAAISATWSPNQLGYAFAFQIGNFGASAVISLILLSIGLVAALIIIGFIGFFRTNSDSN